jgi:glycosyltransferase involved in cell wall biosynthesis
VLVKKLTVAVPVYNERERVGPALEALLATPFPVELEVLVVDDGSSDGTWEHLATLPRREGVRMLQHPANRGKGAALRTALAAATGDVFVPFDADLEYDPRDLLRVLEPILDGRTEVVFGTRTFGSHSAFNFWYVVGNRFINLFTNVLFNCYISDLETCYKMVSTDVMRSLDLTANGFDIEPEVTAKLLRAGHRPYEVAITYVARSRAQGKKINWQDGVAALWTLAKIRFGRA